jgi:hypothetical protein
MIHYDINDLCLVKTDEDDDIETFVQGRQNQAKFIPQVVWVNKTNGINKKSDQVFKGVYKAETPQAQCVKNNRTVNRTFDMVNLVSGGSAQLVNPVDPANPQWYPNCILQTTSISVSYYQSLYSRTNNKPIYFQ